MRDQARGCVAQALESRVMLATVPSGFSESQVASGITNAMTMQFAPDGRLFVCEQGGALRVIKNGVLQTTPFMTLNVNSQGERGLLGVAFDPSFATTDPYIYVHYTTPTPVPHNRISRFTASGDVVVPNSEVVLFEMDNPTSTFHNGASIDFGKDGKIYVSMGDNLDDGADSQSMTQLRGKMIRINKDGSIPSDNPFYNTATGKYRAIWALGLRNPYTFSVQPGTGKIFINDVGEEQWEEINEGKAGANYGWPSTQGATTNPAFTSPIHAYNHNNGCAVTAGTFYNPASATFPSEYVGDYFYADYCDGYIKRFDLANPSVAIPFATGLLFPVDMKTAADGSIYYLSRDTGNGTGAVYRIQHASAPTITSHPADQTVAPGQPATFSVSATAAGPIAYQWQRNGVDIGGATNSSYTIPSTTVGDSGAKFRAKVSSQGATGTLQNGPVWTSGQVGSSLNFDGSNDYVATGNLAGFLGGTATLSAWIKTNQVGNATMWLAPGLTGVEEAGGGNDIFWGWIDGTGRIGIQAGDTNGAKSTNPINNNAWHHVAFTRDSSNGQVKVYVDGALNSTVTSSTGVKTTGFSSIGRIEDTGGTPTYFKGQIDEFRAYNRVLSATEIAALASPPTSGLVSYWKFDEGAGPTTLDSASTGFTVTSNEALLTVAAGTAPSASIDTPLVDSLYSAGETISYSGSATDQDETLTPAAFTWKVDLHHDDHSHPLVLPITGATSGSFVIPDIGEKSPNVFYRITLTVKDSNGLTSTVIRDVLPRKVTFTVQTTPAGIPLKLDAQPISTPLSVLAVVGIKRELEAPSPVTVGGTTYEFVSWSDGGAAKHEIATPTVNTTYTATYRVVANPPTYVSDLTRTFTQNGYGPVEKDKSNGENATGDGNTITLNGVTYSKGLGVHAASDLRYNITGLGYTRFISTIGVDDEVGNNGSVIFRVFVDGVKIYDSGTMTGASASKLVDVSVIGVKELKLVVTNNGDGKDYDHADWADARLLK